MNNLDYTGSGGKRIPKTSTSPRTGSTTAKETGEEMKKQQAAFELERKRLEIEKDQEILQHDADKHRAESERDALRTALEAERIRTAGFLEQVKLQGDLFSRMLLRPGTRHSAGKSEPDPNAGYVAGLVGYHALKRLSADITKALTVVVGMGSDVRIMIVDQIDYAAGDIPYIEVTSQLSVLEVRCRKQVATNKELSGLAFPEEERSEEGKVTTIKSGATRLAPLVTGPWVLPAINAAVPVETGAWTNPDIPGYSTADNATLERKFLLNTAGLISAVAGSLRSEKRFIYVYNFYSLDTTGPQSKLMNMYAGVLECSSRLAQSRNRLLYYISKKAENLAELKNRLKKYEVSGLSPEMESDTRSLREEIQRERGWLDRANTEILASDAVHAELGAFIRSITRADPLQNDSKLARAVFREKVHELGITHLLYLGVLSSGGESITKRWFWGTGTTSYLGGGVASYILSRVEGEVIASDTLPVLYLLRVRSVRPETFSPETGTV